MNLAPAVILAFSILLAFTNPSAALDRLGVYELLGRSGVGDLTDWEPLYFESDSGFVFQSKSRNEEIILGWNESTLCRLFSVGNEVDAERLREDSAEIISLARSASASLSSCRGRLYFAERPTVLLSIARSIRGERGVIAWPGVVTGVVDAFPEDLEESIGYLVQLEIVPTEVIAISANRVSFRTDEGSNLLMLPDEAGEASEKTSPMLLSVCDTNTVRDRGVFEAGPLHSLGPEIDVGWQLVATQKNADPAAYWICGRLE